MKISENNNQMKWELKASREISYQVIETENIFDPANPSLLIGQAGEKRKKPGKHLFQPHKIKVYAAIDPVGRR